MNKPQHTPGPWKWQKVDDKVTRLIQSDTPWDTVLYSDFDVYGGQILVIEKEEDAKLILAAPEMLALLEEFVDICEFGNPMKLIELFGQTKVKASKLIGRIAE